MAFLTQQTKYLEEQNVSMQSLIEALNGEKEQFMRVIICF